MTDDRHPAIAAAAELRGVADVLVLTSYGEDENVFDALAGAAGVGPQAALDRLGRVESGGP